MKILGIDTSTAMFSVCLCEEDQTLVELKSERSFKKGNPDANLFIVAERLIKILNDDNLSAIALSIGPGMFTSLRVGLSLAKGLHLSKNIPLYGVNTLDAIAKSFSSFNQAGKNHRIICIAIMEAFQGEFFVAFYDQNGRIGDDKLITPQDFVDYINRNFQKDELLFVIGPGALTFKKDPIVRRNLSKRKYFSVIEDDLFFPSASKIVRTALPRIRNKKSDNPDVLEPYYIKETSAETKAGRK
ncbi:MAG: tRNA (adenosine(37)-N6)-threonylcarbamoyltransferase complex dimerization subunit type 1 TsaB [bacterium]